MARPKKEKELKRNHIVTLRFNDTEFEIVADVPELKKLVAEFGKIGRNLNQIARHFNQGGIHSQEMHQEHSSELALYEAAERRKGKIAGTQKRSKG